ncbi:circadian clock KaiB family protein [Mucilaginibacter polytrichastri]|uniref:KaiB-like protein 1 n=1 Tax=Mucilaginibacter polytrichastri TaxID=1302689 RepID=A0A1Q5ZXU3_9SPHI|nr:circadian clock KaiB family protein [Mucilaginibacter polytrichastri]OKS86567.1 KaiB-like protein 1 [Mucilaginibacter polytrichastri]SFS80170.1 circadian clock protein KaiB [Mucilaginibacter polytrichastri]
MSNKRDAINWDTTEDEIYELRLFVTGTSPTSVRAINNLHVILEQHLKGRYELEIIDVYQQPLLATSEDISAIPVLVKKAPSPVRRLVGDMSDTNKVLRGLGLL